MIKACHLLYEVYYESNRPAGHSKVIEMTFPGDHDLTLSDAENKWMRLVSEVKKEELTKEEIEALDNVAHDVIVPLEARFIQFEQSKFPPPLTLPSDEEIMKKDFLDAMSDWAHLIVYKGPDEA